MNKKIGNISNANVSTNTDVDDDEQMMILNNSEVADDAEKENKC